MSPLKAVRPSLKCSIPSMEEIGSQVQHMVLKHRIFQSSLFYNQLSPIQVLQCFALLYQS